MLFGIDGHVDDGQKHTHSEVAHGDDFPVVLVAGAVPERVRVRFLGLCGMKRRNTEYQDMTTGQTDLCNNTRPSLLKKLKLTYKPPSYYRVFSAQQ